MLLFHLTRYCYFGFAFRSIQWIYYCAILLVLTSCGHASRDSSSKDQVDTAHNDSLYKEVMIIHDKMMPKMGDIYSLKSRLQKKITNSSSITPEIKDSIQYTIRQLDLAGKSMMDWMHQFTPPSDTASAAQKNSYLENQMYKIKTVAEKMSQAIKDAETRSKLNP